MASFGEIVAGTAVEIVFAAVAVGILYRVWGKVFAVPQRATVLGFQRGVVMLGGQYERTLDPGRHWVTPKRTLIVCDMRPKPFQIPAQELLTSDRMGVRISLGGEYRITDPALFVTESSDSFGAFYLELRQALLATAAEMRGDSILQSQTDLISRMRELVQPRSAQLGIELTHLNVWEAAPIGWVRETE